MRAGPVIPTVCRRRGSSLSLSLNLNSNDNDILFQFSFLRCLRSLGILSSHPKVTNVSAARHPQEEGLRVCCCWEGRCTQCTQRHLQVWQSRFDQIRLPILQDVSSLDSSIGAQLLLCDDSRRSSYPETSKTRLLNARCVLYHLLPRGRNSDSVLLSITGVPEWYRDTPPEPPYMPGTAPASSAPGYTSAHSRVMHMTRENEKPWMSLVLFNHSPASASTSLYHNEGSVLALALLHLRYTNSRIHGYICIAQIRGEVRMFIEKPKNIASIDVWVRASSLPALLFHAYLQALTAYLDCHQIGQRRRPVEPTNSELPRSPLEEK